MFTRYPLMLAAFGSLFVVSGVLLRSFMRRRRGPAPTVLDTMHGMAEDERHLSRTAQAAAMTQAHSPLDLNVLANEILALLRESATGSLSFDEGSRRLGVSEVTFVDAARRLEDRDLASVAMGVVYLLRGKLERQCGTTPRDDSGRDAAP